MKPTRQLIIVSLLAVSGAAAQAQTTVLSAGHTDIGVGFANNAWSLNVGYDVTGEEFDANNVLLRVNAQAQSTVPVGAAFTFLGAAGSPVWLLPQAQDTTLLFLGYGADGLADGAFVGNQVRITLKGVTGPGSFAEYELDSFGSPVVFMNTRDGISAADHFDLTAGGDAHTAWAFSQPGRYTVSLEASGTLTDGNTSTSSGPVAYTFEVVPEPATLALLAGGLVGLLVWSKGRKTPGW